MIVEHLCGEENVRYTKVKKALSIVIVRVFLFNAFFEGKHDYVNKLLACVYLYVSICMYLFVDLPRKVYRELVYICMCLFVDLPRKVYREQVLCFM